MKMSARGRAGFFKLRGKRAPLSFPRAPREFQRNSRAKTQAAARRSALPPAGRLSPNASSRSNTSTSPGGYDVSWLFHRRARVDAFRSFLYDESVGRLAQLVRAPALQAGGRRFEPCTAHHPCAPPFRGDVVQLVRTLPRRWLESYTVTADPYLPYPFPLFSLSPAVHSYILRVFAPTSLQFSPLQRFSKLRSPRRGCSESTTYGGRQRPFRAEEVLFGSTCSPIVPHLPPGLYLPTSAH